MGRVVSATYRGALPASRAASRSFARRSSSDEQRKREKEEQREFEDWKKLNEKGISGLESQEGVSSFLASYYQEFFIVNIIYMAILFVSIKFSQSLMTRINTQSYE